MRPRGRAGWTGRLRRLLGASLGVGLGGGALVAACGLPEAPERERPWSPCFGPEPAMPCPGVCRERGSPGVPFETDPWQGPELFWRGKPSEAPSCASLGMTHPVGPSKDEPETYYATRDYFSDPGPGGACPGCGCTPPLCTVPDRIQYAYLSSDDPKNHPGERCESRNEHSACDGFEPAGFWDGSCLRHDAVPAARLSSAFVMRPILNTRCDAFESPAGLDALVGTLWRVCQREFTLETECDYHNETCLPPAPEGFRSCVMLGTWGDPERERTPCPSSYPERSLVSSRIGGCAPCGCTTVTPPECTLTLSRYRDPDCNDLIRADTVLDPQENTQWTERGESCLEMPTEGTVGGVSVTVVVDREGSCEVKGGDQDAEPVLENDTLLCCEAPSGG